MVEHLFNHLTRFNLSSYQILWYTQRTACNICWEVKETFWHFAVFQTSSLLWPKGQWHTVLTQYSNRPNSMWEFPRQSGSTISCLPPNMKMPLFSALLSKLCPQSYFCRILSLSNTKSLEHTDDYAERREYCKLKRGKCLRGCQENAAVVCSNHACTSGSQSQVKCAKHSGWLMTAEPLWLCGTSHKSLKVGDNKAHAT